MINLLALGQMSEDLVAALIVKKGLNGLSWNKIAERLDIPRSTFNDLATKKKRELRSPKHKKSLHNQAEKSLSFPWSADLSEVRKTVRADMELLVSCAGKKQIEVENRIMAWHAQAKQFWIEHALNPAADPASRVLYGRLGAYVTLQVTAHRGIRNALTKKAVEAIDADNRLSDLGAVYEVVGSLVAQDQAADLYEGEFTDRKQRGACWLRFLTWNDYLGWLIGMTDEACAKAVRKRNERMKLVIEQGFVEESAWAADLTGYHDLIPVKNPWTALMLAGDWSASVAQAQTLFEKYPEHLYKRCQGEDPIISDPDNWPGLAAVANEPLAQGLGNVRDWLANADQRDNPALKAALEVVKPIVANGGSHQDAMNAIKGLK